MTDKLFNGIYKDKKVFLTGNTGFKGSWLALWLTKLGAQVHGYSLDIPTKPSHFELLKLEIDTEFGDILDKKRLHTAIDSFKPDIVFHMAAQPLVRKSYALPVETFETNIIGTLNVLESCRKAGIRTIINITSDKCYENKEHLRGYTEDDPMGGKDPYSASKGCAELVANSYRHSFFNLNQYGKSHSTLLADVRAGNVIGGGDWADDRLIPDLIKAASINQKVIIRYPRSIRPWQHVLEPLSGYLQLGWKLLEGKLEFAQNWNFGPNNESDLTVNEVIERSKKIWDKIDYQIQESSENFHEAGLLKLDSTKARSQLKWSSVWDLNQTFEKTIAWYKNYYLNSQIFSEKDLDDYIQDAQKAGLAWTII
ncbi:MAG: CDP-glucose 4,6-dehydratase [Patescibacteria group bacterium]|jgi:CDP-glucose 4,6-dehydratase